MNWSEELRSMLESRLQESVGLRGDYEKALIVEDDPGKKSALKSKISDLKNLFEKLKMANQLDF